MKFIIQLLPLLLSIAMTVLCLFVVDAKWFVSSLIISWVLVFILWIVLFVFRLFKRFENKLMVHTAVVFVVIIILFGSLLIRFFYEKHQDKLEGYRYVRYVKYSVDGNCSLWSQPIPYQPKYKNITEIDCTITNPTKYEFDEIELEVTIYERNTDKKSTATDSFRPLRTPIDSQKIIFNETIEPYGTKRLSRSLYIQRVPASYSWDMNEIYKISAKSFAVWKKEIVRQKMIEESVAKKEKKMVDAYRRTKWWVGDWYTEHNKGCAKVTMENDGRVVFYIDQPKVCSVVSIKDALYDFQVKCDDTPVIYGRAYHYYSRDDNKIKQLGVIHLSSPTDIEKKLNKIPDSSVKLFTSQDSCVASQKKVEFIDPDKLGVVKKKK